MTLQKLTLSEIALLRELKASIANDPYDFDGLRWCQKSYRELADTIGADSTKTVERALKKPFVTDTTVVKGIGKVVLIRMDNLLKDHS